MQNRRTWICACNVASRRKRRCNITTTRRQSFQTPPLRSRNAFVDWFQSRPNHMPSVAKLLRSTNYPSTFTDHKPWRKQNKLVGKYSEMMVSQKRLCISVIWYSQFWRDSVSSTRKPSLDVAPTTLAQKNSTSNQKHDIQHILTCSYGEAQLPI